MDEINTSEGFRSVFEFYDAEELKFKLLAEEARRKKQEVLIKWKEFRSGNDTGEKS